MNAIPTVAGILGLVFGLLAALAAFLITSQEYMHHYPDPRVPLRIATLAGVLLSRML